MTIESYGFEDQQIRVYDRKYKLPQMRHINYGHGLLRASALDEYPRDAAVDLVAVQTELSARGELAAYEERQGFYEIGSHVGLNEFDQLLRAISISLIHVLFRHLKETSEIAVQLNPADFGECVPELIGVRTRGGRLFVLSVSGSGLTRHTP